LKGKSKEAFSKKNAFFVAAEGGTPADQLRRGVAAMAAHQPKI